MSSAEMYYPRHSDLRSAYVTPYTMYKPHYITRYFHFSKRAKFWTQFYRNIGLQLQRFRLNLLIVLVGAIVYPVAIFGLMFSNWPRQALKWSNTRYGLQGTHILVGIYLAIVVIASVTVGMMK